MAKRIVKCSICSLQAYTKPNCEECKGFGEYWTYREVRDVVPSDSLGGMRPMVSSPKPTEREVEAMRELSRRGWEAPDIAREFNYSEDSVMRVLRVGKRRKRLTEEEKAAIWVGYDAGKCPRQIAMEIGRPHLTVRTYINRTLREMRNG